MNNSKVDYSFTKNENGEIYSLEDVESEFIDATNYWYTTPENSLYQKRQSVSKLVTKLLKTYCETEKEPDLEHDKIGNLVPHEIIYITGKIFLEWVGIDRVFFPNWGYTLSDMKRKNKTKYRAIDAPFNRSMEIK